MINDDRKYKYTKQLLKIAKECGNYNNGDIAVKAGLSRKSVKMPSNWCTGKTLATERQMNYFIKTYGHLLKRKLEHLFYFEEIETGEDKLIFRRLSGEIILKHQIKVKLGNLKDKSVAVFRIVIINNGHKFHVIRQYRAGVIIHYRPQTDDSMLSRNNYQDCSFENALRCDNEEANWFSYSLGVDLDLEEMVQSFNDFKHTLLNGNNPIDIAVNDGKCPKNGRFFTMQDDYSLTYIFYQKMMKLGLNSDTFPF